MWNVLAGQRGFFGQFFRVAAAGLVLAFSGLGSAHAQSVPGAPLNPMISNINDNGLTVDWSAPTSDGGSPITQYRALIHLGTDCTGGIRELGITNGSTFTATITNRLAPGTQYSVDVQAFNAIGGGATSTCTNFMTTGTPVFAPSAPLNPSSSAIGQTTATIHWDAPASDGGSPITGYNVRFFSTSDCSFGGFTGSSGANPGDRSVVRNIGLDPGTVNYFNIVASNVVGPSPPSTCETFTTLPGPPGVPQNLSASSLNTSITALWEAPASDGGSPITNYEVQFFDGLACAGAPISTNGTAGLGFALGGRTPGTDYSFRVRAENAEGSSDFSSCQGVTTTNDTTGPDVSIDALPALVNGPFTATIRFTEDVTGFDVSDVVVGNGTASNFSGTGDTYSVLVSPTDANVTIDIPANAATDLNGNASTAATQVQTSFDGTAPTLLSIERNFLFEKTNLDQLSWIIEFDEEVVNLDVSDFTITGSTATVTTIGTIIANRRLLLVAEGGDLPDLNANVTLGIIPAGISDAAGNNLASAVPSGTNESTFIVDNIDPTVTITAPSTTFNGPFTATFTFSEDVFVFEQSEITAGNATVSDFNGSGSVYTALITPSSAGTVTLDVAAGVARDIGFDGAEFGNPNEAAQQLQVEFDDISPGVTISGVPATAGGPFTATFTFTESVTGFELNDIGLSNATASNFSGSGDTYTALITPVADGQLTIDVAAGVAQDESGNDNLAAQQAVSDFDATPPSVTISGVPTVSGPTFTATFTFSEDVTGFELGDIVVTGGSASDFAGSGTTYTALVTAVASGTVTVAVPADVAADAAGNQNTASEIATTTVDADQPTVTITAPADHIGTDNYEVTITFSESVTGFDAGDVIVGGGATLVSLTGSGASYIATIAPPSVDADITVDVMEDAAQDSAGNGNQAAAQASTSYVADNTRPTVTISDVPASTNGPSSFTIAITFSEDVVNFTAADIGVSGGSVTELTGSGANYSATIQTTGVGDTVIFIAENVAEDAAGNGNTASDTVTISNTLVQDTQRLIAGFLVNRMNNILQNQPDLISFANGPNQRGNFSASGDTASGRIQLATSLLRPLGIGNETDENGRSNRKFDIWAAIYGGWTDLNTIDSNATVAYFGAHAFVSDNVIVGGLVQFDWTDENNSATNSRIEGNGWMAGPYIAGKFANSSVGFEARAAWGSSDNQVSPLGTFIDSFDTSRWLARAKLNGTVEAGEWDIVPNVAVSYFSEKQKTYTDTPGNVIPSQRVSLGEVNFGPEIARNYTLPSGTTVRPKLGVAGVWNFDVNRGAVTGGNNFSVGTGSFRAKVSTGLSVETDGWRLAADAHYDGIGTGNYDAYGVSFTASLKF